MGIDFERMTGRAGQLYRALWEETDFPGRSERVVATPGSRSGNSYAFRTDGPAGDALIELFGIEEPALFRKKLAEACGGNGREERRITTLHSSALCALLFFYRVTSEHPLILKINGKELLFDDSVFEYQNPVIDRRFPSNIDVVLLGRETGSERGAVLFLESKFSEYFVEAGEKSGTISARYLSNGFSRRFYEDAFLKKVGMTKETGKRGFTLHSREAAYMDGYKQMISHYVGIRNLLAGPGDGEDPVRARIRARGTVCLGEIVFDRKIGSLPVALDAMTGGTLTALDSYRRLYGKLAAAMNEALREDGSDTELEAAGDLLAYSLFERNPHRIEQRIREFYF